MSWPSFELQITRYENFDGRKRKFDSKVWLGWEWIKLRWERKELLHWMGLWEFTVKARTNSLRTRKDRQQRQHPWKCDATFWRAGQTLLVKFSLATGECLTLTPWLGWSPANVRLKFTSPETRLIVLPDRLTPKTAWSYLHSSGQNTGMWRTVTGTTGCL